LLSHITSVMISNNKTVVSPMHTHNVPHNLETKPFSTIKLHVSQLK